MRLHARGHRVACLLAASALSLTSCSGADEPVETAEETTSAEQTTSAEPSPSQAASTDVPEDEDITPPGAQLAFGDSATVAHELPDQEAKLDLRVDSAVQGALKDFQGFQLDDPYKKRGNYYYVRVMAKNTGKKAVGGFPVPLWGISGDNTLLRAVKFESSFAKCPTEPLPKKLEPKQSFKTCLVYLAPDKGELEGVSYRPTEDVAPIEWRGPVKMLDTGKQQDKKKDKKKDEKKQ